MVEAVQMIATVTIAIKQTTTIEIVVVVVVVVAVAVAAGEIKVVVVGNRVAAAAVGDQQDKVGEHKVTVNGAKIGVKPAKINGNMVVAVDKDMEHMVIGIIINIHKVGAGNR